MAELVGTGHGRVLLVDGRLQAQRADGEPAAAGDGVAADLVDAVLTGDGSGLHVSPGRLDVIRTAGTDRAPVGRAAMTETAIAVDQTHLSIVVAADGQGPVVVKLVREWGGADRAARLLSTLAAAGSRDTPTLRGYLDWTHPALGRGTVCLVSDFLLGATDGWTWAVDDVLRHVRDGGPAPGWPRRVGALTARLHADLAGASTSAPPGAGAIWRSRAGAALDEALHLTRGAAGVRLANRADAMRTTIASIPDDTPSPLFAIHGDLHVGQLLRAGDRYWAIDFDGDPQLPRDERDRAEPAARDLAHLLVSVDQVGCVAQRYAASVDPAYPAWAAAARRALRDSYAATLAGLGRARLLDDRLLAGLEVEQMARELIYAARFLPRWTYAGDGTVTSRFARAPGTKEQPWTPPPSERT